MKSEKQLLELLLNLQEENYRLKQLLKQNNISFNMLKDDNNCLEDNEQYDLDQSGRILEHTISDYDIRYFYSLFWGRTDVYARRGKNGGYFSQCLNRWNNSCPIYRGETKVCIKDCSSRKYAALTKEIIYKHLLGQKEDGSDVIGVYPLFNDDTCRFIAFDFDNNDKESLNNEDWIDEVW